MVTYSAKIECKNEMISFTEKFPKKYFCPNVYFLYKTGNILIIDCGLNQFKSNISYSNIPFGCAKMRTHKKPKSKLRSGYFH